MYRTVYDAVYRTVHRSVPYRTVVHRHALPLRKKNSISQPRFNSYDRGSSGFFRQSCCSPNSRVSSSHAPHLPPTVHTTTTNNNNTHAHGPHLSGTETTPLQKKKVTKTPSLLFSLTYLRKNKWTHGRPYASPPQAPPSAPPAPRSTRSTPAHPHT